MILRFDVGTKCCCDGRFPICKKCEKRRRRRYRGNRDTNDPLPETPPKKEIQAVRIDLMCRLSERLTALDKLRRGVSAEGREAIMTNSQCAEAEVSGRKTLAIEENFLGSGWHFVKAIGGPNCSEGMREDEGDFDNEDGE